MSYGGNWNEIDLDKDQLTAINGKNGNGKCLDPNTEIEVVTNDDPANIKTITLYQLYCQYHDHPESVGSVLVRTQYGFKKILDCQVTAKNSPVYQMTTVTGKILRGSPTHRVLLSDGNWEYLKNLTSRSIVKTIDGDEQVRLSTITAIQEDLLDIEVEEVHEYYSNGIISHNSSFINALTFCLFNKAFNGANKGQLVNSINGKQLEVEVYFDSDIDHYKVIRGVKPSIFQIYKNDKLLNESSSSRDYQSILENQILRMSFKTFIQTIVVGTASFIPFMELNANDRRVIVEDLLGVGILTTMNQLLKQKVVELSESIQQNQYDLQLIKNELQNGKTTINTLKQAHKNNIKQLENQLKHIDEQITKHNTNIEKINTKLAKLTDVSTKYDQLKKTKQQLTKQQTEIQTILNQITKRIQFVTNNQTCPTCNQLIDVSFKERILNENQQKQLDNQSQLSELKVKLDKLIAKETKFIEAIDKINKLNIALTEQNSAITMLNNQQTTINKQINQPDMTEEIEQMESKLRDRILDAKQLMEVKEQLLNTKDIMYQSSLLLKDSGIKTAVVNQYLPIINQMVNKYLADMEFYLSFELDNQFNETIKARGRDDLSYQNLSQGERRRLDMAIMFTWRYIAQLRNSCNCSNIFVDEILDSSLDQAGIEAIMKLFRSFQDSHIFVISHRESVQDLEFDKVLTVSKRDQFSNIEVSY